VSRSTLSDRRRQTAAGSTTIWRINMNKRVIITSALAAAIAGSSLAVAQAAPASPPKFKAEKCYGIAKAGKNDCASASNNSCAGLSRVNADPKAWIFVPAGYCDRIVGASKKPKA
jgi:uncharacterized membrane protein